VNATIEYKGIHFDGKSLFNTASTFFCNAKKGDATYFLSFFLKKKLIKKKKRKGKFKIQNFKLEKVTVDLISI